MAPTTTLVDSTFSASVIGARTDNAGVARKFFERVATGRRSVQAPDGKELTSKPGIEAPLTGQRTAVFDFTDPESEISFRLPPL